MFVVGNLSVVSCRHVTSKAPFTRYNLLSNRLSNRFDNWSYRVYKHSTGRQTRLTTGVTTGCIVYTAGLTTGWMFVYTIQPVVNLVVQPVVSCKQGISIKHVTYR